MVKLKFRHSPFYSSMLLFGTIIYRLNLLSLLILPVLLVGSLVGTVSAQVPDEEVIFEPEESVESGESLDGNLETPETPVDELSPLPTGTSDGLRPLQRANNVLSFQRGVKLAEEAETALEAQNYALARENLQEARQIFNQLSNFYQQLSQTFSGIDNRISDSQRQSALETAQLRDRTTYQLALVHSAENQPELAVPLLIQIIRSQNPTSELGLRAYNQLVDLGFADLRYPLPEDADPENPPLVQPSEPRPLQANNSILSLAGGENLMAEASAAIDQENYGLAQTKLQEARQVFNQLSTFYQQLSDSFSGIESLIAERQRKKALDAAQLRDRTTYQLALVHRSNDNPELAVPLLLQIVRSQNPTTDLGKRAYQQLFELGFVETPYPRPRSSN
ncbi:hypothetical protein PN462_19760 [Spirulina sp. CS-785/01]|nr:hypothetical protein [Spirulina sp. CS-785/01]MDB9315362.1 hypothetical protein [Spirulina sp. CS-785/01]